MMTATLKLTERYNQVMTGLADAAGVTGFGARGELGRRFVREQCGQLTRTLINVTPPRNLAKTRAGIDKAVPAKFKLLNEDFSGHEPDAGTGMTWYHWNKNFLYGMAPAQDKRKASVDDLYKLYFRITKTGRLRADFRFARKHQRVLIWQKTVTKVSTGKKLATRLKGHIGRLKAGWLPSWDVLKPAGRPPAAYVTKHRDGARGAFIDGLGIPNQPTFTIINRGLGIRKAEGFLRMGLAIRIRAMGTDTRLYLRGVKERLRV